MWGKLDPQINEIGRHDLDNGLDIEAMCSVIRDILLDGGYDVMSKLNNFLSAMKKRLPQDEINIRMTKEWHMLVFVVQCGIGAKLVKAAEVYHDCMREEPLSYALNASYETLTAEYGFSKQFGYAVVEAFAIAFGWYNHCNRDRVGANLKEVTDYMKTFTDSLKELGRRERELNDLSKSQNDNLCLSSYFR